MIARNSQNESSFLINLPKMSGMLSTNFIFPSIHIINNIQKPVWIIYINFQTMSNFDDFLIGIWTPQLSKSISPPRIPPGSALYSLAVAALNIKRRAFRVAEGAQSHSEAWIAARMAKYKTSTTMMTSKKQHLYSLYSYTSEVKKPTKFHKVWTNFIKFHQISILLLNSYFLGGRGLHLDQKRPKVSKKEGGCFFIIIGSLCKWAWFQDAKQAMAKSGHRNKAWAEGSMDGKLGTPVRVLHSTNEKWHSNGGLRGQHLVV